MRAFVLNKCKNNLASLLLVSLLVFIDFSVAIASSNYNMNNSYNKSGDEIAQNGDQQLIDHTYPCRQVIGELNLEKVEGQIDIDVLPGLIALNGGIWDSCVIVMHFNQKSAMEVFDARFPLTTDKRLISEAREPNGDFTLVEIMRKVGM